MRLPLRAFGRDTRGAVALMFGLVVLVLVGAVGIAFDYSRLALMQTSLQRAVDAAALLAAKNRESQGSYTMPDAVAANYMKNTFDVGQLNDFKVQVNMADDRVRVDATGNFKMTISNVIGVRTMPVKGSSEVLFGDTRLEIALVLDNTGSMNERNKLTTLRDAANHFVDKMQAAATSPDAIQIALVPFDTNVNLGALKTSSWVESSSQTFWGSHPELSGCIWDRDQPNDTQDTAPSGGSSTLFSADVSRGRPCNLQPILPLSSDFSAIHAAVNGMRAAGNTDTTIGLVWGLHVLTASEPVTNAAPPGTPRLSRYIIFMTDGDNTQNRWTRSTSEIDGRTRRVCDTIRSANIQVFTARIIEGNASLLRGCATTPDMYFDIQTVSQLDPVFDKIYNSITATRIAR